MSKGTRAGKDGVCTRSAEHIYLDKTKGCMKGAAGSQVEQMNGNQGNRF